LFYPPRKDFRSFALILFADFYAQLSRCPFFSHFCLCSASSTSAQFDFLNKSTERHCGSEPIDLGVVLKISSFRLYRGALVLTQHFDDNPEEEMAMFVKIKPSARERASTRSSVQKKPARKTSYESNAAVQRWLRQQVYEEPQQIPSFNPTLLASKRDAPWILSSLTPFYEQQLITDVLHEAHSGKEATVYCCKAHPSTGVEYLAAKIYRPRMFRSLRNDAIYRFSRVQRDE